MFGIIADLITTVTTILFPIFASYKALRTSDPAQLTPWLMYWVVVSLFLVVENFFDFILSWVPFYSWMRLFVHLYLMMPGEGGATQLYQQHIDPFLTYHEAEIDRLISQTHEKAKAAGWNYAKQAIDWVRVNVLGQPPRPPTPPPSRQASAASYTQALLSRFAIPSARPSGGSGTAGDVLGLLGQALSSAAALYGSRDAQVENLTASGTLIPRDIPAEDRPTYVNAQRERLRVLLQAFDREAFFLASEPERRSDDRLTKSRSDADFDRIEVSEADERYGGRPPLPDAGAPGWMPWNWGGGARPPTSGSRESDDEDRYTERYEDRYEDRREDIHGDRRHDRHRRRDDREDRHGKSSGFDVGY